MEFNREMISLQQWLTESHQENQQFIATLQQTIIPAQAWPSSMDPPDHWQELLDSTRPSHKIIFWHGVNLLGHPVFTFHFREIAANPESILSGSSAEGRHSNTYGPTEQPIKEFPALIIPDEFRKQFPSQIKRTVKHGIYFIPQSRYCFGGKPLNQGNETVLSQMILDLEQRQIIKKVPRPKKLRFLAHPFLVTTGSKTRLIVNYKRLSRFLQPIKMVLPFYGNILKYKDIQPTALAVTMDLRDAFYQIKISQKSKKYTLFTFLNEFYVFQRLPIGLSLSPGILQIIITRVVQNFHPAPQLSWIHVDDILIIASPKWFRKYLLKFCQYLEQFNITINYTKSNLFPAKTVNYCGTLLNIPEQSIELTTEKIAKTMVYLMILLNGPRGKVRSRILGYLNYIMPIIKLPFGVTSLQDKSMVAVIIINLYLRAKFQWERVCLSGERIFVDATPSTIAVVTEEFTRTQELPHPMLIYWAEFLAVLAAAYLANPRTVIYCDNMVVVHNAKAHNFRIFNWYGIILHSLLEKKKLVVRYVKSARNPADLPSRQPENLSNSSLG